MTRIKPEQAKTAAEFLDAHIAITSKSANRTRRIKHGANIAKVAGYILGATGVGLEFKELLSEEYVTHINELYVGMGATGFVAGVSAHIISARKRLLNNRLVKRLTSLKDHKDHNSSLAGRIAGILDHRQSVDEIKQGLERQSIQKAQSSERPNIEQQIRAEQKNVHGHIKDGSGIIGLTAGGCLTLSVLGAGLEGTASADSLLLASGAVAGLGGYKGVESFSKAVEAGNRLSERQTDGIVQEYYLMRGEEAGQAA